MSNGNTTIDMLLSKEEQTRIGINNDDVEHIRPLDQKLCRILEEYNNLLNENKRLRKSLEWFSKDLKEIETMNEPTFFTICQRWLPHIAQVLKGKQ